MSLYSFLFRPKKNGTATGVNAICSYHHNPAYPELDTQGLYTKLSQLTHGITQLGSYMLDQNSLYVNGECDLWFAVECFQASFNFFLCLPKLLVVSV